MTQVLPDAPANTYQLNLNHIKCYQNNNQLSYANKQLMSQSESKNIFQSLKNHHQQQSEYRQTNNSAKYQILNQINEMKQKQKQLQRINNVLVNTIRLANFGQRENWKHIYERSIKEKLQVQLQKESLLKQLNKIKNQKLLQEEQKQAKKRVYFKNKPFNILSHFSLQIEKPKINKLQENIRKKHSFSHSLLRMETFMNKIGINKKYINSQKVVQTGYESMFSQQKNHQTTIVAKQGLNTSQKNYKNAPKNKHLNSILHTTRDSIDQYIRNKRSFKNKNDRNIQKSDYYQRLNKFLSCEKSIRNIQQKKLCFS